MISDCKLECNVIIYFRKENYHFIFVIAPCIIIMIVVIFCSYVRRHGEGRI